MRKLRKIRVRGRVQGVFFRASAREQAEQLDLAGFARNEPDGSVYIEIEGESGKLDEFEAWCQDGPAHARVEQVSTADGQPAGYQGFKTE